MTAGVNPADVMARLDGLALELDARSKELAAVERDLEPLREWHEHVLDASAVRLWAEYRGGDLRAFPSEAVRRALAEQELDAGGRESLARLTVLDARRKRLIRRLDDLGRAASATQSILSALRAELEATNRTGGPSR